MSPPAECLARLFRVGTQARDSSRPCPSASRAAPRLALSRALVRCQSLPEPSQPGVAPFKTNTARQTRSAGLLSSTPRSPMKALQLHSLQPPISVPAPDLSTPFVPARFRGRPDFHRGTRTFPPQPLRTTDPRRSRQHSTGYIAAWPASCPAPRRRLLLSYKRLDGRVRRG